MGGYNTKREKPLWKRARGWLCFLMLSLMMATLIFYSTSILMSWPLPFWKIRSLSNHFYKPTPVGSVHAEADPGMRGRKVQVTVPELQSQNIDHSEYFVKYPHQYRFILDEPIRCHKENPFLVILIPVPPQSRGARDIIRRTWGKDTTVQGQVVNYYFLLGLSKVSNGTEEPEEQILLESQEHHDILQSEFLDSYKNLTIKTMLMFEWLSARCPSTSYAMKVDSDIFLNLHNLVDVLLKAPRQLYMTGLVIRNAQVLRNPNSKWFLPATAFPELVYPPYPMGLGYVFSLDLAKRILEASAHIKAVYIEDVYVGLCMRHLGIELRDPPRSGLFMSYMPFSIDKCYWASVITTMLQNSEQLLDVWKVYKTQAQSGC
ncbi:beta-1,3-galactosyltransferase 1-like [Kryptolebias marmoratus]|uniref:Hexosyltransferase n=1 Tax=Kryptolebias marmoratus TaxID=37003 RepID=A0A3Q3A0A6_KRYMA|nr:beta-1,3-galactosyltransferase 1-like [Kryptolebias marmoratus]XP_017278640.1 beta-1,3-galactosyltransferase 1-like [Kryptolebias marmoratus]